MFGVGHSLAGVLLGFKVTLEWLNRNFPDFVSVRRLP